MTPRTFLIVALVAVASLVAAAMVVTSLPPRHPIETDGEVLFPGLADQTVARLVVRTATGPLTIERGESGWRLKERDDYPVDVTKVRETIVRMAQTILLEPKTTRPERHALLDLVDPEDPAATETTARPKGKGRALALEDTTGKVLAALIVGKRRFDLGGTGGAEEGIYVRRPGEAQTWLARTSLFPAAEPRGWVDPTVIGVDPARVTRVTFRHSDGQVVMVSRTDNGPPAVQPLPAHADVDEGTAQRVLALLSNVTLEDVRKKDAGVFKADKTIRIEVVTREGLLINVAVHDHDGATWITVNATGRQDMDEEAKMVNDRTRGWLYRLPSYNAAVFHSRQSDLVKKGADKPEAEGFQD